jgi:hypothetical protein
MAIDRTTLTGFLAIEYDTLLVEAGIAGTDTPANLGPVLDAVDQLVVLSDPLSPLWLQPLARYFTLKRIVNRLAVNMDVSISGDSYRLNQIFANAKSLLSEAKAQVAWIVDPVQPGEASDYGDITVVEMPFLTGTIASEYGSW